MAANIPAAVLAQLRAADAATYNKMALAPVYDPGTGRYYQAHYAGGKSGEDYDPGYLANYTSYPQSWADGGDHTGETSSVYGTDGSYSHEKAWTDDEATKNLMLFAAAFGGLAFLPGGLVSTLSGAAPSAALGTNGAFLGEGVASGVPAWDLAATNAGLELTAGGFIAETAAEAGVKAAASTTASGAGGITAAVKGVASTAAGLVSTAAKAAGSILTLKSLGGGSGASGGGGPITTAPVVSGSDPALLPGVSNTALLIAAVLIGGAVLVPSLLKKG